MHIFILLMYVILFNWIHIRHLDYFKTHTLINSNRYFYKYIHGKNSCACNFEIFFSSFHSCLLSWTYVTKDKLLKKKNTHKLYLCMCLESSYHMSVTRLIIYFENCIVRQLHHQTSIKEHIHKNVHEIDQSLSLASWWN